MTLELTLAGFVLLDSKPRPIPAKESGELGIDGTWGL